MKIMIAYDGSRHAEAALDDLKRAGLPSQVEVLVVTVAEVWLPPPSSWELLNNASSQTLAGKKEQAHNLAESAVERLIRDYPSWTINSVSDCGSPAATVIAHADQWRPDLIIVGSHGFSTVERFFLGSVSQRIISEAHGSVRVARGRIEEMESPVRNLIGFDGSPYAEAAVRAVAGRNWPKGSEARLITSIGPFVNTGAVVHFEGERSEVEIMQNNAASILRDSGLQVTTTITFEDPKHALVGEAGRWGADCLFVGNRGLGRLGRLLLGSVSTAAAARANCSVEIVRTK